VFVYRYLITLTGVVSGVIFVFFGDGLWGSIRSLWVEPSSP
jgi:hypothetical protein